MYRKGLVMRQAAYVFFWFCLGLALTFSLGCATIQRTKVSVGGIQDGVKYSVEYNLEY